MQNEQGSGKMIALVVVALAAVGGIVWASGDKKEAPAPVTTTTTDTTAASETANAVAAGGVDVVESTETPNTASDNPAAATTPTPAAATTEAVMSFKDGTYNVVGKYTSPKGPEEIAIKLTLKDGKIADVVVTPKATFEASINWQTKFAGGVKAAVVGKSIADLKLDKVSGSSLTPQGFNDGLEQVRAQAKA